MYKKTTKLSFLWIIFVLQTSALLSQETQIDTINNSKATKRTKTGNKGKVYFYWGWNISQYSNSDIHFSGNNYDFTIHDAKATDRVTPVTLKYIHPGHLTIPQTNARLGYYFHDNWNISLGLDHMKYVMTQFQIAKISGVINISDQENGITLFNGKYDNRDTILYEEFVEFEHTDGLNYINLEIARVDNLGDYIGLNPDKFQLNLTEGIGFGALLPKTNARILDKQRHDEFHLAGYGISIKSGINLTFFKNFFIQAELKGGFIDLPNIRTTKSKSDKAEQHFFFLQQNITFGGVFQLF